MPPKLTADDWCILAVSIILALILPGCVILLLPFAFVLVILIAVRLFAGK